MLAAMGFIARAKLRQGGELRPMRIEIVDTGADIGRKLVRLCARPVYRRGHSLERGLIHGRDDRLDESVLGAEVVQHHTHCDAGAVGDLSDRGLRIAHLCDDVNGARNDLLPAGGLGEGSIAAPFRSHDRIIDHLIYTDVTVSPG
ncbi:Uncharacterised protein [Mycobacteroides abscessus subsp. abscessus]|nr:Uncharacterised protein [Mycobacteroides abscessus subsp. abscessus]